MPGTEAFQYALLRAMPSLDRRERVNVGVVVYSPRLRFLSARTTVDDRRLAVLDPGVDLDGIRAHLEMLERVAAGEPSAGPIARLPRRERFGWITAPSSTLVQPSSVHTGLCDDAEATLERLFRALVAAPER